MKEVIERCNWLVNKCEDKALTPDVKDDVRYLLEEIEALKYIIMDIYISIYHELHGHILQHDEDSWNPEYYTNGKLDYRKLLIGLLSDYENRLSRGIDNDEN